MWILLGVVLDVLVLVFFYKRSFSDLSYFTPLGYALKILVLFVAAYITADSHPRFSSPNLVSPDSLPQERRL